MSWVYINVNILETCRLIMGARSVHISEHISENTLTKIQVSLALHKRKCRIYNGWPREMALHCRLWPPSVCNSLHHFCSGHRLVTTTLHAHPLCHHLQSETLALVKSASPLLYSKLQACSGSTRRVISPCDIVTVSAFLRRLRSWTQRAIT